MNKEASFQKAMHDLYVRAWEQAGHRATYFLQMLEDLGGLVAAKQLINSPKASDGFTALWEKGHLELTVEALALQSEWQDLFTSEELTKARRRLREYGFEPPEDRGTPSEPPTTIDQIARELNARAGRYLIGNLQTLRQEIKALKRRATSDLFVERSTSVEGEYAFHYGGRSELQFNVGFEDRQGERLLRHGVAFSLAPSQALPDPPAVLLPKIRRFNTFLRAYPSSLTGFLYWFHDDAGWSRDYEPREILPAEASIGTFLFLGRRYPPSDLNYDAILGEWDHLLQLYEFVETDGPIVHHRSTPHETEFSPGHKARRVSPTTTTRADSELSVTYRHNLTQNALYVALADQFGPDSVRTEWPCAPGIQVDAVVDTKDGYWFYEIKTAPLARYCIREAFAQLLEYAYWPAASRAERLIIVGEPPPDSEAISYIEYLRRNFDIPVYYQQFDLEKGILV